MPWFESMERLRCGEFLSLVIRALGYIKERLLKLARPPIFFQATFRQQAQMFFRAVWTVQTTGEPIVLYLIWATCKVRYRLDFLSMRTHSLSCHLPEFSILPLSRREARMFVFKSCPRQPEIIYETWFCDVINCLMSSTAFHVKNEIVSAQFSGLHV